MIRTITMTFEADAAALAKAVAALFGATPFGYCIEIAAAPNPMCEAERPDEGETPRGFGKQDEFSELVQRWGFTARSVLKEDKP